ncbi:MAG: FMN-binding protein [Verrucomicrobia bacterium]|nr:FMN-binding protein [Verrucomicrobiota bacterium]MBU1910088.1 FMN-binding protein [Verrucomicrobiota bacterium]
MKNSYIGQAWLVVVLSLCFGAALAAVQTTLQPRIEQNKLADTIGQIPKLVPGAAGGELQRVGDQVAYRAMDASGQQVGWVLAAAGQGFADRIELLIGMDAAAARITGLYVLDQKETPGLGNKIVDDAFCAKFQGRATEPVLVVTKHAPQADREIEGITGATISSESVVGIVNAAVAKFREAPKP